MKNMKSILPAIALLLLSSSSIFATGKDNKDVKTTVATGSNAASGAASNNVKPKQTFTYYVTALSGGNYTLSTTSEPCRGSVSPCEITSPEPLPSSVAQTEVDGQQNGIVIVSRQAQL